jgi:hypothetical protein
MRMTQPVSAGYQYVRWVEGRGVVLIDLAEPLGESGKTAGDLLALVNAGELAGR